MRIINSQQKLLAYSMVGCNSVVASMVKCHLSSPNFVDMEY